MANNPVFGRFEKQMQQGEYAGFGNQPRQQQVGQQPYGQPAPQFGQQQQYGQPAPPQQYGRPGPQPGYGQPTPSPQQLEQMYAQGTAGPVQTGRMTVDDVLMKTLGLFGLLLVLAVAGWFAADSSETLGMGLWGVGLVGTLGLGLAIAFKKTISVPLIVAYAVLEGLFVGAISQFFNTMWPGIVAQAVLGTMCVFAGMFIGWKVGFIRVTAKSRRIFGMALMGYMLFAVANLVFALVANEQFGVLGQNKWLGLAIGSFAVLLASYSLAVDFDSIDRGVRAGVPEKTSWLMAHGLIVSIVWLYLELLRLLAILQSD